ncbi:MAG: hypothetical protein GC134_00815 [Proteobacteria bacterium]|nr:hypothetical protein [Pseudomonadota bacterium]
MAKDNNTPSNGNDHIVGTENADVIDALKGNDHIEGLGGDDTLRGGEGNDNIDGGTGAKDKLYGDDGNDQIDDEDGVEVASGGDGNDSIVVYFNGALTTPTYIQGDAGNDTIDLTFSGQDISSLLISGDSDTTLDNLNDNNGGNDVVTLRGSWIGGTTAVVNLNGGNDTLINTSATSGIRAFGGAGNDTLIGGGGDDYLDGGVGTDVLSGGAGNDTLVYSADALWTSGWSARNTVTGQQVDINGYNRSYDAFDGGDGTDQLLMGSGNDAIFLDDPYSSGPNSTPRFTSIEIIDAGAGNDVIDLTSDRFTYGSITVMGGSGNDVIWTSAGDDYIDGGAGYGDILDGGAGSDTIIDRDGAALVRGGTGNDTIALTFVGQDINGFRLAGDIDTSLDNLTDTTGGNDIVSISGSWTIGRSDTNLGITINPAQITEPATYTLVGTSGNDTISGGAGNNTISGGDGNDTLHGDLHWDTNDFGNDIINAGAGNDYVTGGGGNDQIIGGAGNDEIYGDFNWDTNTGGDDIIYGGDGNDLLVGGRGNDTIVGGNGNDTIQGDFGWEINNPGNDVLDGGAGNDTITGGDGNDDILGGDGDDTIYGDFDWQTNRAGADRISGGAGNDTIIAGGGDDIISGGAGDDVIYADYRYYTSGDGNDTISGGAGNDTIYGGGGNDTAVYAGLRSEYTITRNNDGSYTVTDNVAGRDGTDTVRDVENFRFGDGTLGIDSLVSTTSLPLAGAWVNLNGGDDIFTNDSADSTIDVYGGAGNDTITGGGIGDKLYGGTGNDILNGRGGDDILYGEAGNDTLNGGTGNDQLFGGTGSDTYILDAGFGRDTITDTVSGTDVNRLIFGSGINFEAATFSQNGNDLVIAIDGTNDAVTVKGWFANSANTMGSIAFADGTTVVPGDIGTILGNGGKIYIPPVEIYGTEGDNRINGTAKNDVIYGLGGNDSIYAGNGNDILIGGKGDDHLYGGAGSDTYLFNIGDQMIRVYDSAEAGKTNTVVFGAGIFRSDLEIVRNGEHVDIRVISTGDILRLSNWDSTHPIDRFVFTESGQSLTLNDINNGPQTFYGTNGIDSLAGTDKNDTIYALDGNDKVYGGSGNDKLIGGAGNDFLYGDRSGTGALQANQGDDILDGGAGDDFLYGDGGNDILMGGAGDDQMYGGAGSDTYTMNIGDGLNAVYDSAEIGQTNTIAFGAGIFANDLNITRDGNSLVIRIGTTNDRVQIDSWNSSPIQAFTFVEAGQSLTVADINQSLMTIYGTAGNDLRLGGTSGDNTIYGLAGNDKIFGHSGNDIIYGGDGNDFLYGDRDIYGVVQASQGNDRLYGGAGDDFIYGDGGNDILSGGSGTDHLYGGAGSDTYLFNLGDNSVSVYDTQEAGQINTVSFGTGIFANDLTFYRNGSSVVIEVMSTGDTLHIDQWASNPIQTFTFAEAGQSLTVAQISDALLTINGTNNADTIIGTDGSDTIYGLGGNDKIYSGTGNDTLYGGDGDDWLYASHSKSGALLANGGNNYLDGGAGNDTLVSGDGNDTIYGGDGNDNVQAGSGNDIIYGGAGNDVLSGMDGNDYLDGGDGVDYLRGGNGNDILVFDSVDSWIWGDTGEDTLLLANQSQTLDLSLKAIRGIEAVDMTNGSGDNTMTLKIADVLRVSDTGIMTISGDAGDNVLTTDTLFRGGDVQINGNDYATFTGNGATIFIQLGLDLNDHALTALTS